MNAVLDLIVQAAPDVIVLQRVDWDFEQRTVKALQSVLEQRGHALPHALAPRPNSGQPTGLDSDGDGRLGEAQDAQGYGLFPGHRGLVALSKSPLELQRSATNDLWATVQNTRSTDPAAVSAVQRLSSVAHIVVAVPEWDLSFVTFHATPPVFDGPEDRNGRRNADEITLGFDMLPSRAALLLGNLNLDPKRGEGLRNVIAAALQSGTVVDMHGDQPTVQFPNLDPMRVSYALPTRDLKVVGAGVLFSNDRDLVRHGLVWIDVQLP